MGRTVILELGVHFAFHILVKAADIVVFPDPGVPAKATRIRRFDEAGFFSRSTLNLSHNVVIVSSIFVLARMEVVEKRSVALLSGEDQLEYCTITGLPQRIYTLHVVDTENGLKSYRFDIGGSFICSNTRKLHLNGRRHLPPMIGRETVSRHQQRHHAITNKD